MNDNIREIQKLYMDEEMEKEEGKVKSEEVILIRLYEISTTTSSSS